MKSFSKLYKAGYLVQLDETKNGTPFFRKEFDNNILNVEKCIVDALKPSNLKNVVTIYDVKDKHCDMELLVTDYPLTKNNVKMLIEDMKTAKAELHKKGVVYIDWKMDNIGYSPKDKTFKLYDFNMSGIVFSSNKWCVHTQGYRYRDALQAGYTTPIEIDNHAFEQFCKELIKEEDGISVGKVSVVLLELLFAGWVLRNI